MYLISDGGINLNTLDTIEAIMLTKNNNNIDGVKLDVRITLDNIFVLSRYNDLRKLTYSKEKVNEVNCEYLKKVKFPSHIFKYYIPTLKEILDNYNKNKIIVLEIYFNNNLDTLYNLLKNYTYEYYFIGNINDLNKYHFNNLGKIIDNNHIKIINSIFKNNLYDNTLLIMENK